ncbi:MAG: tRNA uridine-5-carboxymethylaminomethyl(34) synthesis GTPase MnmE, partial [Bacteroidetes bacterium]|nr:tRNA uridine-5-carboxymethylaminomethyl(34) synthesis GTPase MnmE [Bacteroidota bacterium]
MQEYDDTIVALATPNAVGAIGIIRLSGKEAIQIVNRLFKGKDLEKQKTHSIHFGHLVKNEEIIDEVLVSLFLAPNSYTKENVAEISCHGSPYIINTILSTLIEEGARMAKHGEFTQRAFLNGRFDLAQAEAVADLIASESKAAHKVALQQMRGGITNKLAELRNNLVEFTALLELELDFGEEDVEFANREKLVELLQHIKNEISRLMQSFRLGNAIKTGVPVAIVGKPNVGKSTLLNVLLQEDRAIVSDIAGTTRDTIEEKITIDGILFRFIDTAGLRETADVIEKIGVERSKASIQNAQIVLYLYDSNAESLDDVLEVLKEIPLDKSVIVVRNKQDISKKADKEIHIPYDWISISAKENISIDALKNLLLKNVINETATQQDAVIISNQRHFEALQHSALAIENVLSAINQQISSDFISQDLKVALRHLGSITGNIDVDKDILATIFGKFCIGK